METIRLNIPKEKLNQLNNYYREHFNYDIYTQLQNFISLELDKCQDYPTGEQLPHPHPSIQRTGKKYVLVVRYPDGSRSQILSKNYKLLTDIWNEWGKYDFAKKDKNEVYLKYMPEKIQYIQYNPRRKWYEIVKKEGGSSRTWGHYNTFEDALTVRNFLVEHDWGEKYQRTSLEKNIEGCSIYNYSSYLLKIIKGEMEL